MIDKNSIETKSSRVFEAFMGGMSLNLFEAQRLLHDRCLHSTVAQIQRLKQITIERKREIVAGYRGCPTSVCRYWISPEEIKRIMERRMISLTKKKAPALTDQNKEKGFCLNNGVDTSSVNKPQIAPKNEV
jgi:hypothetical protein